MRSPRWWRETLGELRKVTWPTPLEAWQLTKVVIVVMMRNERDSGYFGFRIHPIDLLVLILKI